MKKNIIICFISFIISILFSVLFCFFKRTSCDKYTKHCNCPIKITHIKDFIENFSDSNIYNLCQKIDNALKKGGYVKIKKEYIGFSVMIDDYVFTCHDSDQILYNFINLMYSDIMQEFNNGYNKLIIQRPLFFHNLKSITLKNDSLILG